MIIAGREHVTKGILLRLECERCGAECWFDQRSMSMAERMGAETPVWCLDCVIAHPPKEPVEGIVDANVILLDVARKVKGEAAMIDHAAKSHKSQ